MSSIRRVVTDLYLATGVWPTDLKVYEQLQESGSKAAKALGLAEVVEIRRSIQSGKPVHLNAPRMSQGEASEDTVQDSLYVGPPKTETVVEARRLLVEYQAAMQRIEAAVAQLPPRDAMVVRLRFGLGEFESMTLEEVGERYAVTRERVRQIEVKALELLQEKLGITTEQILEIVDITQELEVIANA